MPDDSDISSIFQDLEKVQCFNFSPLDVRSIIVSNQLNGDVWGQLSHPTDSPRQSCHLCPSSLPYSFRPYPPSTPIHHHFEHRRSALMTARSSPARLRVVLCSRLAQNPTSSTRALLVGATPSLVYTLPTVLPDKPYSTPLSICRGSQGS